MFSSETLFNLINEEAWIDKNKYLFLEEDDSICPTMEY